MDSLNMYEQGPEEAPGLRVFFSNFLFALWFAVGTFLCAALHPYIGLAYLIVAMSMVTVVMRKLVCTNCWYYGKWCSTGWGKLASLMFSKGDESKFRTSIGVRMAPAVYGLLALVPLVLGTIAVIISPEQREVRIAALVGLVAVTFYSGYIARKKTCSTCRMNEHCPGSAAPAKLLDIEKPSETTQ